MADVKWIKITTDIFDDEKILLIESMPSADSIIVVWFKLLAFAGKQNNDGVFLLSGKMAYTDEMLATIFRRDVNTVRMALSVFEQFGMVEIVDNVITIPNWNKHQSLDAYEKKKAYDRQYRIEQRAKQKQLALMSNDNRTDSRTTVVVAEEDKEEELEEELDIKKRGKTPTPQKKKEAKPFVPPTLEEIEAYCQQRGNKVDAKRFFDYFDASEWVDSKGNKVRNWKQKVITWEGYAKNEGRKEIVPDWMKRPKSISAIGTTPGVVNTKPDRQAEEDMERMKRYLDSLKTAGNDAGVAAKAEDLKKRLAGGTP